MVGQFLRTHGKPLLKRVGKIPVWLILMMVFGVGALPNALVLYLSFEFDPEVKLLSAVSALLMFFFWAFGFSTDDDWLGIPPKYG